MSYIVEFVDGPWNGQVRVLEELPTVYRVVTAQLINTSPVSFVSTTTGRPTSLLQDVPLKLIQTVHEYTLLGVNSTVRIYVWDEVNTREVSDGR